MADKARRYATLTQELQIVDLLKAHVLPPINEGAPITYEPGWSDEVIWEATGAPFSAVQRIRRELYGKIRLAPPPAPPPSNGDDRLALIELNLRAIADHIGVSLYTVLPAQRSLV